MDAIDQFLKKKAGRALEYKDIIEGMLTEDYGYATDTLEGILEHINETGDITDRQVEAIDNIRAKPQEDRAYERDYPTGGHSRYYGD